jgi:hypothetical protein
MKRLEPGRDVSYIAQRDGRRLLFWSRRGRIRLAVIGSAVALAAGAAAGCGTSDQNSSASDGEERFGQRALGPPELTASERARFRKFRDCLSEHGVELPEPGRDGARGDGGPPPGLDPGDSELQAAMAECGEYAPQGGPPGGAPPGGDPPRQTGDLGRDGVSVQ